MPLPIETGVLTYKGQKIHVIVFEGIVHLIAPGLEPSEKIFWEIKSLYEKEEPGPRPLPAALGVMFFNEPALRIKPAVYVYAASSLVFESSCGSGSAALGCWLSRNIREGETEYAVAQSGGVISVRVKKTGGNVAGLAIGGEVSLGKVIKKECAFE
jgi:diaminopimelate epimerase